MQTVRHTKIVCTLGPASWSIEKIRELIAAGMNVARLNFSHGTHEEHAKIVRAVRNAAEEAGVVVGVLQDLQGPKIRLGQLPSGGLKVVKGGEVVLVRDVPVEYEGLAAAVKPGMEVIVGDGAFLGEVARVEGEAVVVRAKADGVLESRKGFAVRGAAFDVAALTEKDLRDLEFGMSIGVDAVALSFVKSGQDVLGLRGKIVTYASMHGIPASEIPMVVAKVERHEAFEHIDAIIAASDAVMVARGDLGLDVALAKVPLIQKEIIAKCRMAAKPVIVATQMLESMIHSPVPTRAEVSDVANAVIDHADAVMLSGETANGEHPVEAVKVMAESVVAAETSAFDDVGFSDAVRGRIGRNPLVAEVLEMVTQLKAVITVCPGDVGLIRSLSAVRPEGGIVSCGVSVCEVAAMQMSWGVVGVVVGAEGEREAFLEVVSGFGRRIEVDPIAGKAIMV